jgi:chromosome segregation ATPase
MNKKVKLLLILLGVVSLAVMGLAAWIYISSEAEVKKYIKKHSALEKQTNSLQKSLGEAEKGSRHWREKFDAISNDLKRLGREHNLLLSHYNSLLKEKDSLSRQNVDLSQEIKELEKRYAQVRGRRKGVSKSDDFLSSLLKEKTQMQIEVDKLKDKIAGQKAQLQHIEERDKPARERLLALEEEKKLLEEKLADARKSADLSNNDLFQQKKRNFNLEQDLGKTEEQLQDIMQERDSLSVKLAQMKQVLEQRLAELDETKKVLETVVEGVKEIATSEELASIHLSPIVVKAQASEKFLKKEADEVKGLKGEIITVNDKYKFVVINLGSDAGVENGMEFDVYRKKEKVARISAMETRRSISACDIKEINVKRLQVKDKVRR